VVVAMTAPLLPFAFAALCIWLLFRLATRPAISI
jgi:hypothetical protein